MWSLLPGHALGKKTPRSRPIRRTCRALEPPAGAVEPPRNPRAAVSTLEQTALLPGSLFTCHGSPLIRCAICWRVPFAGYGPCRPGSGSQHRGAHLVS